MTALDDQATSSRLDDKAMVALVERLDWASFRAGQDGNDIGYFYAAASSKTKLLDAISALQKERDEAKRFKDAVIEGCVVRHIYMHEHETDPRKALNDCAVWDQQVALDPAVSKEAEALRDTHKAQLDAARGALTHIESLAIEGERDSRRSERVDFQARMSQIAKRARYGMELAAYQPGIAAQEQPR